MTQRVVWLAPRKPIGFEVDYTSYSFGQWYTLYCTSTICDWKMRASYYPIFFRTCLWIIRFERKCHLSSGSREIHSHTSLLSCVSTLYDPLPSPSTLSDDNWRYSVHFCRNRNFFYLSAYYRFKKSINHGSYPGQPTKEFDDFEWFVHEVNLWSGLQSTSDTPIKKQWFKGPWMV